MLRSRRLGHSQNPSPQDPLEFLNRLLKQAGGGLLWGLFIVFAPFELVFFGAVVWIPLFIWREAVRTGRYGFWKGAVVRYPIIAGMIVIAVHAPFKYEDARVGPLPRQQVSLGDLVKAGILYDWDKPDQKAITVQLPSLRPTRREVMDAIKTQTGFNTRIFHCANGSTLVFGGGGGRISVSEMKSINNSQKPQSSPQ